MIMLISHLLYYILINHYKYVILLPNYTSDN